MFPYVTAGPIVRASEIVPGLQTERPSVDGIASGVVLFLIGLTKKIVVAETFGRIVEVTFAAARPRGLVDAWVAALSFAFEIYADFSGYSDMAIGVAMMLGLRLPQNFDAPFRAVSVVDFWKRWHISLSRFITTYLYTPMIRMHRRPTFRAAMVATVASMVIAGLWHGAAWTYVAFGLIHGLGLVATHLWRRTKIKLPRPIAWAAMFLFILVTFTLFRSTSLAHAWQMYECMLGLRGWRSPDPLGAMSRLELAFALPVMIVGAGAALLGRTSSEIVAGFRPSWRWAFACATALVVCLHYMNASATKGFIYRGF
jgi:D-alanyl-lipoteichoic acid acyltransferase DltB (MBOAT superfamily)